MMRAPCTVESTWHAGNEESYHQVLLRMNKYAEPPLGLSHIINRSYNYLYRSFFKSRSIPDRFYLTISTRCLLLAIHPSRQTHTDTYFQKPTNKVWAQTSTVKPKTSTTLPLLDGNQRQRRRWRSRWIMQVAFWNVCTSFQEYMMIQKSRGNSSINPKNMKCSFVTHIWWKNIKYTTNKTRARATSTADTVSVPRSRGGCHQHQTSCYPPSLQYRSRTSTRKCRSTMNTTYGTNCNSNTNKQRETATRRQNPSQRLMATTELIDNYFASERQL